MEREYIIIYKSCEELKTPFKIGLDQKLIDYWAFNRIRGQTFNPENINLVIVGPKTVFEYYESPHFTGHKNRLINASETETKILRIGCEDRKTFRGKINSFIIWSYDYFNSINGIKYCEDDYDCRKNESCLCKDGKKDSEWCPTSRRRCMHTSRRLHDAKVPIRDYDMIDCKCLMSRLMHCNNESTFSEVKDSIRKCLKRDLEAFNIDADVQKITPNWKLFIFIVLFVLFLIVAIMLCNKNIKNIKH